MSDIETPFVIKDKLTKANALRGVASDSKRKEQRDKLILEWIDRLPEEQKNLIDALGQELSDNARMLSEIRIGERHKNPDLPKARTFSIGPDTAKVLLMMIVLKKEIKFPQ